ncbi:hypothetical protein [Novosphingobium olei]|uniref:Transmembrane protein n=1 Tax=Novosphingobium olei TaxID=2728851 RepID=A0A7Y0BRC6_9SPHN|nr:hypothetical protein [Novosphingobium olei]NML95114.1 hypothetical protein [Novosphingobium olei]
MSVTVPARLYVGRHLANGLRLVGWLAVNALVALGAIASGVLALGNFCLGDAMAQLGNLAMRFAAAPAEARHSFTVLLSLTWSWGFCAAAFFRRGTIARAWERGRGAV